MSETDIRIDDFLDSKWVGIFRRLTFSGAFLTDF